MIRRVFAALLCSLISSGVASAAPRVHDGSHDFDFDLGVWQTQITRLAHPFTQPRAWSSYRGTVSVRPVWSSGGDVEEIEANGPSTMELLAVRLYDGQSGQWSINGASSADAALGDPLIGGFTHGEGVFFDQAFVDGHTVLVRQRFFHITPSSYSFEEALSHDAGRTWIPDFIAALHRTASVVPSESTLHAASASHDFDFNYGRWSTHITTPSGSLTGVVSVRKIWGGRAFIEAIAASNASGGFSGLTLFLYDPRTREWSQTYAGKGSGAFERSMIGTFHAGVGELVAFPDANGGKMTITREIWSQITPDAHHFEIQYSEDGVTWHTSFSANLTRIGPGA